MTECSRRQKAISSYDLAWETRRNTEAPLTQRLLNSGAHYCGTFITLGDTPYKYGDTGLKH